VHRPATPWSAAALALACALALGACRQAGDAIVIGTAGPLKESYAQNVRNAVEMALDEANKQDGVNGRPLQLRPMDDEGDGVKAAAIARQFREDPAVAAVVGHANSGGMVGAAAEYDEGLVAVVPSATSPEITGISEWVFRVTTNDSVNGANIARFAGGLGGGKRVAVLYENNVYGRDLARAFLAGYRGTVVGVDPIAGDGSKVEPFVSYYRAVNPELVFVAGTEQSGRALLKEAQRQGWRPQWLAGDGWTGVSQDTAAAEGAYVATPFSVLDTREEARRFVDAFHARYGTMPDANAAMAYDATHLLVKAMREVGSDRGRLRDYLARVRGDRAFRGVTGQVGFRPDGDPENAGFVMTRVANGTLQPLEAGK
jgi:branched-chain amino acid transport system substrate-binding protein